MRVFLLDLWLDLRQKRLAPIAVLLLAAIIAVPIVIAKGTKNESAPPPPPATTASAAPVVQSNPQAGPVASKLQDFSARDPFAPTGHVATAPASAPTTTGGTGGTSTGTSTTTNGTGTPTGGGTTGTPGTTTTGGTGNTGTTTPQTKTTLFTYTVDMRFGPPGDEKLLKGVQRLELIPDQQSPKVVFLGVTSSQQTAVFLVDASLGVDTNGKCKPSADQCTFLYLRPDGQHDQAELTDQDGNTFRVHLLKIHRVVVGASTGSGNTGSGGKNGSSNRSPAFTGSADSRQTQQNDTATGDSPPGEPSQPFTFSGFFADGANGAGGH